MSTTKNQYASPLDTETAVIEASASLSGAIATGGLRLFSLLIPSAWTAANITFQVSATGAADDYHNLRDASGNEVTATVAAAGDAVNVDYDQFAAWPYIKIRSGTSAAPVAQAAARAVGLALRSL